MYLKMIARRHKDFINQRVHNIPMGTGFIHNLIGERNSLLVRQFIPLGLFSQRKLPFQPVNLRGTIVFLLSAAMIKCPKVAIKKCTEMALRRTDMLHYFPVI